jgi:hypothetical protein
MSTFSAYIRKQKDRPDSLGDFSRDFIYILKNHPNYPECRGTDSILSETLFGQYNFLPNYAQHRDYIIEALSNLWKEWLEYKHIGLKYNRSKRGYVYFFRLPHRQNVFKIGRTTTAPEKRMASVATSEKTDLQIYDWIKINHYDIIEKELHAAFKPSCLMREWFELPTSEIDKAIHIYSQTDQSAEIYSIIREEEVFDGKFT